MNTPPPDFSQMSRESLERFASQADHDARNWKWRLDLAKGEGGPFAGMPWYVRAAAWFGLPVAILAFYFAQDAGIIPSLVRSTHANVLANNAALVAHIQKSDAFIERVIIAMRISCENQAKDASARLNCANIR